MRAVVLVALLLLPSVAAQADAVLRYPPQNVYEVVETETTWNERSVAAPAGSTLLVHFEVRIVGNNGLTSNQTYTVEWWLDDALLATLDGTLGPETSRVVHALNATLPDSAGDRTLRLRLITGAWDTTPGNNDPPATLLRIGDVTGATRDGTTRHPFIGPALLAGAVVILLPFRWHTVRARAATAVAPASRSIEAWRIAWPHMAPQQKLRLRGLAWGTLIMVPFITSLAATRRLALQDDPTSAAGIAAFAYLVTVTAASIRARSLRWRHPLVLVATFAAAATWQQAALAIGFLRWPQLTELGPFVLNGITVGALYALVALGYTMVYGILKFINFAHGDVFVWGGYLGWMLVVQYPLVGLPLAMLWAMFATAGLGAAIERVAYRPLRGGDRLAPLITAIAVSLLLAGAAQLFFGAQSHTFKEAGSRYVGSPTEAFLTQQYKVGPFFLTSLDITIFVTASVLMGALQWFIRSSRLGQAMRAVADDAEAAETVGIPVDRVITWTFVLGSALAAVGGVFWGLRFSLRPTLGLLTGIKAFTAAVVGGIGNIPGAFLGGFLIGLAENVGGQFIDSRFQNVIAFLVLIVFLLVRPQGMFGKEVKRR